MDDKLALTRLVAEFEGALRPFAEADIRPDDADTMRPAIVQAVHFRRAASLLAPEEVARG